MSAPESPLNIASLLRAAADGELTADHRLALEAHLEANPQDEARVAFERSLREAVSRSMGGERVPTDLESRVRGAVAESDREEPAGVPIVETIGPATRERSFWASVGGRLAFAAAVLLVVSGVWYTYGKLNSGSINNWDDVSRVHLARFLSDQHMDCADPVIAGQKFTVSEVDGVDPCCQRILSQTPRLEGLLAEGGELVGLGRCGVPGPGDSVHMQVRLPLADGGITRNTVSLFIQERLGREGKAEDTCYSLKEAKEKGQVMDVWQYDGLIYYLVCDTAGAAEQARKALRVAKPNQRL